jgi:ribosomal protein L11 methylase PrmA
VSPILPKEDGRLPSSFRDPSGFVFKSEGQIYRQINQSYLSDWNLFRDSGLYENLVQDGLIIPVSDADIKLAVSDSAALVVKPEQLPFVSYPYEWCFSQMKAGALLTLDLMRRGISKGLWLKDASNFNIQFRGAEPVHFDTLSFERYPEGEAWTAYGQFCRHFLGPLVASAYLDSRTIPSLRMHIDGFPLDLVSKSLPWKARLNPGIALHIRMHGKASKQGGPAAKSAALPKNALLGMLDSLSNTVSALSPASASATWVGYYEDNNYEAKSQDDKSAVVRTFLESIQPKPATCWDLGANTGHFSEIPAGLGIATFAFDFDPDVVEKTYSNWRSRKVANVGAYVQDLTNPSPRLGWANSERDSFTDRGPADVVLALALIHHLAIGNNVPLEQIADWFGKLGRHLIIEFVDKEDSQVIRMLSTRRDVFIDYHQKEFERAFGKVFEIQSTHAIPNTKRTLYLMRNRG